MSAPEGPDFTQAQIEHLGKVMAAENIHPARIEAVLRDLAKPSLSSEVEVVRVEEGEASGS